MPDALQAVWGYSMVRDRRIAADDVGKAFLKLQIESSAVRHLIPLMLVVQALGVTGEQIFDTLLKTINEAITDEVDPEFANAERAVLIGLVEQAKRVTRKCMEQAEKS